MAETTTWPVKIVKALACVAVFVCGLFVLGALMQSIEHQFAHDVAQGVIHAR